MNRFFYRLNNVLIFATVFFVAFIVLGFRNQVSSELDIFDKYFPQQATTPSITPSPTGIPGTEVSNRSGTVINKRVDVDLGTKSFEVLFGSDGQNGAAGGDQKASFSDANLPQIPIPLAYEVKESYAELPGELIYGAINKPNGNPNAPCRESDANKTTRNDADCLYYVTAASVFSEVSLSRYSGDLQTNLAVEKGISLGEAAARILNEALSPSSFTDQSRDTLGTLSFWASDEINQLTPIRVGSSESGIQNVKVSVAKTAVNRDEGLFLSDFSAQVSPNTIRPLDSASTLDNDIGISTLNNPFIFKKTGGTATAPAGSLAVIIQDAFKKALGNTSGSSSKRLSAQIPLRAIKESNESQLGYNFCASTTELEKQGKWKRQPFANPFPIQYLPTLPGQVSTGEIDPNSDYGKYEDNTRVTPLEKLCLGDIAQYQGAEKAKGCAENYIKNEGCDEETIEEENLMFEPIQQSFPFGLGAYFQNATLYDLNPNVEGPFINYLSPYYCSKLNVVYNVKPGTNAPYIYKWSSGDKAISYTRSGSSPNQTAESNLKFNNQYCVVGALLSNFSWALMQQQNLFGSNNNGSINLPKEGLTCDKKETAFFGGSPVEANIQAPNGKLIYKNSDNKAEGIGRGFIDSEDVLITHGYDIYSLNHIVNEIKRPIQKYKDNDIKVVVDGSGKPKFVHLVEQPASKTANRNSYLCRLRQNASVNPDADRAIVPKNCFIIDSGNQLLLTGDVSYSQSSDGREFVTIVGYDRAGSLEEDENGELPALPPPDLYYYVIEIKSDISKSILTKRKLSGFANEYQAVQLPSGAVAILTMELFDGGKIRSLKYYVIDPISQSILFPFNGMNSSPNLCDFVSEYCRYIGEQNASAKLVLGDNNSLYAIVAGNGLGLAIPLNLQAFKDSDSKISPSAIGVFAYKKKSGSFNGDTDFISSARFVKGEFHIFMKNSGYYLKVFSPSTMNPTTRISEVYKQCTSVDGQGSNNCLITIQEEFNTKNFMSDCSNYLGTESGSCGYEKLSKLSQPDIYEFSYYGPDNINAWYTYKNLDNTILYSPDIRFSYTGLYTKISDLEYSNVYVPSVSGKNIEPKPIQYFNYGIGGIQVGKHIQKDADGNMTPILAVMKPARYKCYQNFSKVTGLDPLFNQTGLQNVNLRSPGLSNSPGTSTGGGLTGGNPGNSCEENWCIADDVQIVNNPMFKDDYKNEELKKKILDFFMTRSKNRGLTGSARLRVEEDYTEKINLMCQKSSEAGIPCSFLAGIWIQESTANLDDSNPNNPPLGCFGEAVFGAGWYKFPVQVDCAIGSMKSSLSKYNDPKQKTLSGYGSVFTPHNEEYDKNPSKFKGSCEPATLYSMVMQRYTPTDKRINFNNQCNNGLLLRDDQGNEVGGADCNFTTQRPNGSTEGPNRFDDGYTELKWPSGNLTDSRMTLRITIENIDPRLKISNQCYKPDGSLPGTNPNTGSKDIKAELAKYEKQSEVGSIRMNLAQWGNNGKSGAAGNVKMILHEKMNDNAKPNTTNSYGVYGIHEIAPGQSFSLNNAIGNPDEGDVRTLEPKYVQQGYTMNTSVPGGGWCEFATTIRTAASRAKESGSSTPLLKESTFDRFTSNPDRVDDNTIYAPNKNHRGQVGFDGNIKNWRHEDVTVNDFNKLVPAEDGVGIKSQSELVLVWSNPGNPDGFNDGDLEILNPSTDRTMVIAVYYDDDAQNMIRVDVFYGKKTK